MAVPIVVVDDSAQPPEAAAAGAPATIAQTGLVAAQPDAVETAQASTLQAECEEDTVAEMEQEELKPSNLTAVASGAPAEAEAAEAEGSKEKAHRVDAAGGTEATTEPASMVEAKPEAQEGVEAMDVEPEAVTDAMEETVVESTQADAPIAPKPAAVPEPASAPEPAAVAEPATVPEPVAEAVTPSYNRVSSPRTKGSVAYAYVLRNITPSVQLTGVQPTGVQPTGVQPTGVQPTGCP